MVDSSSTYTSSTLDSTLAASNSDPVDENQLFQQIFAELRTSGECLCMYAVCVPVDNANYFRYTSKCTKYRGPVQVSRLLYA